LAILVEFDVQLTAALYQIVRQFGKGDQRTLSEEL
jgi:hypothetical protein